MFGTMSLETISKHANHPLPMRTTIKKKKESKTRKDAREDNGKGR